MNVEHLERDGVGYVQVDAGPPAAARIASRAIRAAAHVDSGFDEIAGVWHIGVDRFDWDECWRGEWVISGQRWRLKRGEWANKDGIRKATVKDIINALEGEHR